MEYAYIEVKAKSNYLPPRFLIPAMPSKAKGRTHRHALSREGTAQVGGLHTLAAPIPTTRVSRTRRGGEGAQVQLLSHYPPPNPPRPTLQAGTLAKQLRAVFHCV